MNRRPVGVEVQLDAQLRFPTRITLDQKPEHHRVQWELSAHLLPPPLPEAVRLGHHVGIRPNVAQRRLGRVLEAELLSASGHLIAAPLSGGVCRFR